MPAVIYLARIERRPLRIYSGEPGLWRGYALNPRPDFEAPIWDEHLSHDQLFALLDRAYRSFYLRPSVVLSQLRRGSLVSKARAGLRMLMSGGPG